jgi:GT2 family glycosyltransferase
MSNKQQITISIVIATRGRTKSLARLLNSLCQLEGRREIEHEVLIANNATDEDLAARIDQLVRHFSERGGAFRIVRVNRVGKAFAVNTLIPLAKGAIIAFLDDDVAVAPDWLKAVTEFFHCHPFAGMQGTILLPPGSEKNPELQQCYHRYRTICLFPSRPVQEIKTLTGANMAFRKEIFETIGLFNIKLGPGQSGTSDDTELGERIIRSGERIGCSPKAVAYHEVDWSRLTESYFRLRHEQQGRSRLIYKKTPLPTIVADLLRSIVAFLWHSASKNERKKYRAKGRCYHYRAMLREQVAATFRRSVPLKRSTRDSILYPQA